jgi:hypothetical protein
MFQCLRHLPWWLLESSRLQAVGSCEGWTVRVGYGARV